MTRNAPPPVPNDPHDRLARPGRWASGQALRLEVSDALADVLTDRRVATGPVVVDLADELARVALQVLAGELLDVARDRIGGPIR